MRFHQAQKKCLMGGMAHGGGEGEEEREGRVQRGIKRKRQT